MYKLFDRIINGDLKPHLINNDSKARLDELLKMTLVVKDGQFTIENNEYWQFCGNGTPITIEYDEENPEKFTIKQRQEDELEELFDINIPPPPDDISDTYLLLIEREFEVIKYKVDTYFNEAGSVEDIELFSLKNIHKLKELSKALYLYIRSLKGEHGNLFVTEKNHFVTYTLEQYLIYCIQHIQDLSSHFFDIKIESEIDLKVKFFGLKFSPAPFIDFEMLALLPKETEFEEFKNEYRAGKKNNKLKEGEIRLVSRPQIGEVIVEMYKKKFSLLKTKEQIMGYRNAILHWEKVLLTNKIKDFYGFYEARKYQIEKIIIPLLEHEIKVIQENSIDISNTILLGFKTTLTDTQITSLYNSTKAQFINTDIQNLKNLLTEKECTPIVWKYYRGNKPNNQALRAFIQVVFQNPKEPKTIGKNYFVDLKDKSIVLNKPVKNQNFQYYIDLFMEKIKN